MSAPAAAGGKSDSQPFKVTDTTHRALGPLRVLQVGDALRLRLTPREAHTLSLALVAVRDGKSIETELFMSPIASDALFVAPVGPQGILVETPAGPVALGWKAVGELAARLAPEASR